MHFAQPLNRRLRYSIMVASAFAIVSTTASIFFRINGSYSLLYYVDIPLHLLGGFIAASVFVAGIHFIYDASILQRVPKLLAMISILGFVALVTISWEILEYFSDRYLGTRVQLSIADTLKDMIVGLVGASPIALAWPRPSHWTLHRETEQGAAANP